MFRTLFLFFLGLHASAALAGASYPPPEHDREGRADVVVSVDPRVEAHDWGRSVVVDGDGRIFVAYEVDDPTTGREIHVMRSLDHGQTFSLWARRFTNDARELERPTLARVPGSPERIAMAYQYDLGEIETFPYYQTDVNVAVARTDETVPSWTVRTVFSATGEDVLSVSAPDVAAAMGPDGPVIHVVAQKSFHGPSGDLVLYAHTTDLGVHWSTPFEVKTANTDYSPGAPRVAADDDGDVCVVWQRNIDAQDSGIARRSATNFAANGTDWEPTPIYLDHPGNGWYVSPPDVAAHGDGSGFTIVYSRSDTIESGGLQDTQVWSTATVAGAWTHGVIDGLFFRLPRLEPGHGQGWLLTGAPLDTDGDEKTWSVFEAETTAAPHFGREILLADTWAGAPSFSPAAVAAHSTMDAFCMMWIDDPFQVSPVVRFDATWWSGPGAPAPLDEFPVQLAAEPVTHPAVVDVTARSAGDEIVFGDADGVVHVVDHFGNALPGWPQAVGTLQKGQAIAVADLDGDGDVEVVVPTATGEVHVFEEDGTPRPGWPVDLGIRAAHVTLAPVSKLTANDVVAVCGTQAFLLRPDGTPIGYGAWPVNLGDVVDRPASVGDLDGDGGLDVVVTVGDAAKVFDADGQTTASPSTGGDAFSAPAALGDLDRDGDLEIVASTLNGFVHAWHHDGTSVAGSWPAQPAVADRIVGITLGNVDGSGDPEVVVTGRDGMIRMFESDGTATAAWSGGIVVNPQNVLAPAILDDVDGSTGEVLHARVDGQVRARHADGSTPFAWPAATGNPIELSPATGDVDGDGRLDLVVLTISSLVRFDLDATVSVDDFLRWTQFGHDARRTHCTASAAIVTGIEEGFGGTADDVHVSFAPPSPNPLRGGVTHMRFALPQRAHARIELFDLRGRRVRTLTDGPRTAGTHVVLWDGRDDTGRDVGTGTYFGRLVVELPQGQQSFSQKVTVMQ